jgi:NAD(P)-dependent dehydrogenase (short-subunit alcohol dehydrogenase family)
VVNFLLMFSGGIFFLGFNVIFAALFGLMLSMKNEIVKIAPRARVNIISPGWVKTPMAEEALKDPMVVYRALAT